MTPAVATVHVVDDDAGIRKSLHMAMQAASIPVRVYESAEQFLAAMDLAQPGCIVLDLRMPGMGGVELLQHLRGNGCEIPVIIISAHVDFTTAVRTMKLGAIDVLAKPFEPQILLATIQNALKNSIAMQEKRGEVDAIRRRFSDLTRRELDLLKLVVSGRSNKQIAYDLDISIKTVANHRASLMAKTGASNAADLARLSTIANIGPT